VFIEWNPTKDVKYCIKIDSRTIPVVSDAKPTSWLILPCLALMISLMIALWPGIPGNGWKMTAMKGILLAYLVVRDSISESPSIKITRASSEFADSDTPRFCR